MWRTSLIISVVLWSSTIMAQTCRTDSIKATTPTAQFTIHGDGTVTDKRTGLMWKQCLIQYSGGDCSIGSLEYYTWQAALQATEALNSSGGFAGYTDWRLPNIKELRSIVEYQCDSPAINLDVFPNTQIFHEIWTSSPSALYEFSAWSVDFHNGYSDENIIYSSGFYLGLHVRLVRSGP